MPLESAAVTATIVDDEPQVAEMLVEAARLGLRCQSAWRDRGARRSGQRLTPILVTDEHARARHTTRRGSIAAGPERQLSVTAAPRIRRGHSVPQRRRGITF